MITTKDKILVQFHSNGVVVCKLENENLKLLYNENILFEKFEMGQQLLNKIDQCINSLKSKVGEVNNIRVRLYATGLFQNFLQADQTKIVIHIFVHHNLYFNIVPHELELLYNEKSTILLGEKNFFNGVTQQEFRQVVICGSFQKNLKEIGAIMSILKKRNISVLSPWTTKIVPETLGTDFILLEGQEPLRNERDAWKHKYIHMDKFRQSDAIIICNPNGHVGQGTIFEIGYMIAFSKRIIFTDPPTNLLIPFPYEIGLNFE